MGEASQCAHEASSVGIKNAVAWHPSSESPLSTQKTDKLFLLSRLNKYLSNSAALCFTETWLNGAIPDSALYLPNFQLIRSDCGAESTGKSRGGGMCFYINERWCTDVIVLKKMCCPDLELLFINCKPFYLVREFCSFIFVSVYIPPQAHVNSALQKLADLITDTEQQHLDSVLIILGDFYKTNLSRELPNTESMLYVPPETVIYWITVTQQ